ncbi:F-box-like domain-containing protein 1 [Elsinoe fawcettii]|nr:F-box-like domain-containing protein 1 [Elsinoe fawcettii]
MPQNVSRITAPRRSLHLPDEILLEVIGYVDIVTYTDGRGDTAKQRNLHACSLVNRQWNAITTPVLYASPHLVGNQYDLFTRTICPSINLNIRKSALSEYVRDLDLSLLVHQGSKSVTARLLGRTKEHLQSFSAPQASFSLNCYPALSKCHALRRLDLSLVSDLSSLKTLFESISGLQALIELHLPRSSGFGSNMDPSAIVWPPKLQELGLSGGLNVAFWTGEFSFPTTLIIISITHCPKFDDECLHAFLVTLLDSDCHVMDMTFAHLPLLGADSLDCVLDYFPFLMVLSVSVDYVTPEVLNPPKGRLKREDVDLLSDGEEYWFGNEVDNGVEEFYGNGMRGVSDEGLAGVVAASDTTRIDARAKRSNKKCRSLIKLEKLELTDSGERDNTETIEPLDVLMYADDFAMVPRLRLVGVSRSLGWLNESYEGDVEALNEWLTDNAKSRGYVDDARMGLFIY